jgi:ABC-type Fe3+-hydroxamate transport system substrate-binding protein
VKAELKRVSSHSHIVDYAKKAVRQQGAEIVLFEFERNAKKIQEELDKLKRAGVKVYYYFSDDKTKIHTL